MARSLHILCIDDEPDILYVMSSILGRFGHQVETALDADTGIHLLRRSGPFDVVVVNYLMPRRSGMDVVAFLAGQRRFDTVGVVLDSAYAHWRLPVQHAAWGRVDVFLPVPFQMHELLEATQQAHALRTMDEGGLDRLALAGV